MAKFSVDTEILQDTIDSYQKGIDEMEQAIKIADIAVDLLRSSDWKSDASRAFFDNYDNSWKNGIEDRIKVIKHLRDCLKNAKKDYNKLIETVPQLGNKL